MLYAEGPMLVSSKAVSLPSWILLALQKKKMSHVFYILCPAPIIGINFANLSEQCNHLCYVPRLLR